MSKKGKNGAAKRRAKKQTKRQAADKVRRKAYKAEQALKKARMRELRKTVNTLSDGVHLPEITDEDYIFWLCHGVNYLMSDADEGLWTPMFEGIYDGNLPAGDIIPNKVMARFPDAFGEDGDLTGLPMAVLAWTITDKSTMRIYRHEAENRIRRTLGATEPDLNAEAVARQPHQPQVWDLINQVKARSMAAAEARLEEPDDEADDEPVEEPLVEAQEEE